MSFIYQPSPSSTVQGRLYYDLNLTSTFPTKFTVVFTRSISNFSSATIKYMATNNVTYFDIQISSSSFGSNTGSIGAVITSNRTGSINIPWRRKSNTSNVGIAYYTVGLSQIWLGSSFTYSLTNSSFGLNNDSYNLQISVNPTSGSSNGISYIRICTISYEIVTLVANQQFFSSLLSTSNLSGTVPGTVISNVIDFSVIFSGVVDYSFIQSSSLNKAFQIALSGSTFLVTDLTARSSFLWLRNLVCPSGYYINATSSTCVACHFSC